MKKICGKKRFTQFSKEHICIDVGYDVQEKTYIISNSPRLSDGLNGVRKIRSVNSIPLNLHVVMMMTSK